jgi:Skp family chaperone for outer membrane proteins
LAPLLASVQTGSVWAQQPQANPGWFVPGQAQGGQRPPAQGQPQPQPQPRPQAAPQMDPMATEAMGENMAPLTPQQLQVILPPLPEIPALPKGAPPPAAVIGVLSVPDILRVSVAYQYADRELGLRRQRLNEDAQREQIALRDLGQAFANERAKMTPEQIRNKEREYQNRINESRRKFGDRERVIREAGQYVMTQIDRALELVANQVATARGVNVVLNRAQLLGTTPDFDLTPQVGEVLNQVLPTVIIPPDGVSPLAMAPPPAAPASVPAAPKN